MLFYVASFLISAMITMNLSRTVDDFPVIEYHGCNNCKRVYVPVCGTDNITYVNACKLNCANSKKPKKDWVYLVRYGPCAVFPHHRANYSLW